MTIINLRVSTRMIYPPKSEIFLLSLENNSRAIVQKNSTRKNKNQNCLIFQVFLCYQLKCRFFHRYFKRPFHRQQTLPTHTNTNTNTKQAKTRAGGQVVEEDDKVEAVEEAEEKHYVPYYL